MKNKAYWLNRAIDRQSTIDKLSQSELNEIKKIYDSSQRELTNMINEIYETYSRKTGLDISELKRLMSYNETDKFWKSLDGQKMKQYVKDNYKSRITRLEAYKAQLQAKCNNLADKQEKIMTIAGKNAIKSSYFKTIYDTSIGVNLDLAFNTLDDRTINLILKEKWLGSNYSDRVWKNTNQLAENLKRILTKTVMTGGSQSRAIKELRDSMNSEWYKAERLVRTEMNHFHNQSELEAYEEMGVEEYVYVATLDNRTSEICQELDGKKFKLSEAEEGVNYPPMHPYCRSTVRAYISKDVEKDMQRRARDPETGENSVINNLTYSEWMDNINRREDPLMKEDLTISIPKKYINNYDDFDKLSLSEIEKKSYKDLNNSSLENDNEAIQVFYENGNTEIIISPEHDKVQIPNDVIDKKHLKIYHSHTDISPLSRADMMKMHMKNVDKIGCITINGDIFEIEIGDGYRPDDYDEFDITVNKIYNEIGSEIVMNPDLEMNETENSYYLIRETMYRVSRYYGWTIKGGNINE